jgi:hypothetical protein
LELGFSAFFAAAIEDSPTSSTWVFAMLVVLEVQKCLMRERRDGKHFTRLVVCAHHMTMPHDGNLGCDMSVPFLIF